MIGDQLPLVATDFSGIMLRDKFDRPKNLNN